MHRHHKNLESWLLYASGSCFAWILGCDSGIWQADPVRNLPVASSEMHDFGIVRPSTINRHTFRYQNPYASAIQVNRLSASCGCVRPTISKRRLEVGEDLELEISFAAKAVGDERHNVTIVLEDRLPQECPTFAISAKVREDIYVEPQRLYYDLDGDAKPKDLKLRVENYSASDWSEIQVVAPEWILAEIQSDKTEPSDSNDAKQSWIVRITPDRTQLVAGGISTHLKIVAQPHAQFEIDVPVVVTIQEPFVVLPKKLILSRAVNKLNFAEARICLAAKSPELRKENIVVNSSYEKLDVQLTDSKQGEWLITVTAPQDLLLTEGETVSVHIPSLSQTPVSLPILTQIEPK